MRVYQFPQIPKIFVEWARIELATNRFSVYHSTSELPLRFFLPEKFSVWLWQFGHSERMQSRCSSQTELQPQIVEWTGLEPAISWSQITNLNQLGHHSICWTCQTRTDNTSARNSRVTITPKSNLTCVDLYTKVQKVLCRTYQIRTDNVRAKTSCVTITPKSDLTCVDFHTPKSDLVQAFAGYVGFEPLYQRDSLVC